MHDSLPTPLRNQTPRRFFSPWLRTWVETLLLVLLFFSYAGDPPPMVNEAHYLVKAKNFWDPTFCAKDLFAASGKAHLTFYVLFGWPTKFISLSATAWIGRLVGWLMIAIGLRRLCDAVIGVPLASLAVAVIWMAGVEYANLAGEWVIGGIEAKVPAYGLALIGIAELARGRWTRVWPWLGAASAFHVLVGGWSALAAAMAWSFTERGTPNGKPFFCRQLFLGGAIALFGLVPSIALTLGNTDAQTADAAKIYAYFRLPHHLLPAGFLPEWYVRHAALLIGLFIAYGLVRHDTSKRLRRLWWFTMGALGILVIGLLVGVLPAYSPDLAAKLLRYYWFRLSDAFVPLMLGLIVARLCVSIRTWSLVRLLAVCVVIASIAGIGWSSYERSQLGVPPSVSNELLGWKAGSSAEAQTQAYEDWVAVCRWVEGSTAADEVLLTPRHQQTFKWYSNRAEVVNWKDVPQDVESLIQWRIRFSDVFPPRLGRRGTTIRYDLLRKMHEKYGVRWMIVDRRVVGKNLPLVRVYPQVDDENQTYAVYALPLQTDN